MEPESSLPYSQVPATCPYPESIPLYRLLTFHVPKKCPFSCYVILPIETPPSPWDPSGGVVFLRIVLSPEEAFCLCIFLNNVFSRGGVSTSPNPQAGGPPLVGCPRLLIQYIRSCLPYRKPFLHPQPEDAPCRGDRDPLITVIIRTTFRKESWHSAEVPSTLLDSWPLPTS